MACVVVVSMRMCDVLFKWCVRVLILGYCVMLYDVFALCVLFNGLLC